MSVGLSPIWSIYCVSKQFIVPCYLSFQKFVILLTLWSASPSILCSCSGKNKQIPTHLQKLVNQKVLKLTWISQLVITYNGYTSNDSEFVVYPSHTHKHPCMHIWLRFWCNFNSSATAQFILPHSYWPAPSPVH